MVIADARKASWQGIQWTILTAFEDYRLKLDIMVADYAWASMMACNLRSSAEECRLYCRDSVKYLRKARFQSLDLIEEGYKL